MEASILSYINGVNKVLEMGVKYEGTELAKEA
jgi:hypothetical protein